MASRRSRASGYALVVLLGVLTLGGLLAMHGFASIGARAREAQRTAALDALQRARTLIIGAAVAGSWDSAQGAYVPPNTAEGLPCPDVDGNGTADINFGGNNPCVSTIGTLPWKTLGAIPPTDGTGACLYYALHPDYRKSIPNNLRDNGVIPQLNPAIPSSLNVFDERGMTVSATPVAAVLIAPGRPIGPQARAPTQTSPCMLGGGLNQYLDAMPREGQPAVDNATGGPDGLSFVIRVAANSPANDLGIPVTREAIMRPLERLAGRELAHALILYAQRYHSFPDAAAEPALPPYDAVPGLDAGAPPRGALEPFLRGEPAWPEANPAPTAAPPACPVVANNMPSEWLCANGWYAHLHYERSPDGRFVTLSSGQAAARRRLVAVCNPDAPAEC